MVLLTEILERLEKTGLRDIELAEKIGIDNSNFGKWRKGTLVPRKAMLLLVKKYLDENHPLPRIENANAELKIQYIRKELTTIKAQVINARFLLDVQLKEIDAILDTFNELNNET